MSTEERTLYTDINFVKKSLLHVHLRSDAMVLLWLCIYITIYLKKYLEHANIYPYCSILINCIFQFIFFKTKLFNLSKDFLQCYRSPNNFVLRLI